MQDSFLSISQCTTCLPSSVFQEHFDAAGQISSETIEEFLKDEYVPDP